jgi:four helix bundle protein
MRRSGLSVSGNISEGFGRKHTNDKLKFYYNARGSLAETKIILSTAIGWGTLIKLNSKMFQAL